MSIPERFTSEEARQLLLRARSGDAAAVDALLERARPYLAVVCRANCPPGVDWDDALQDTVIRLFMEWKAVDPNRPFLPFAARVAQNACIDRIRKLARAPLSLEQVPGDPPGPGVDPVGAALHGHVRRSLDTCLATLSHRERLLIELTVVAGLRGQDLRKEWPERLPLWRSRQTLNRWLDEARNALSRCLKKHNVDEGDAGMLRDILHGRA